LKQEEPAFGMLGRTALWVLNVLEGRGYRSTPLSPQRAFLISRAHTLLSLGQKSVLPCPKYSKCPLVLRTTIFLEPVTPCF